MIYSYVLVLFFKLVDSLLSFVVLNHIMFCSPSVFLLESIENPRVHEVSESADAWNLVKSR